MLLIFQQFGTGLFLRGVGLLEGTDLTEPASTQDIWITISIRIAMVGGCFVKVFALVREREHGPLSYISVDQKEMYNREHCSEWFDSIGTIILLPKVT